MDKQPIMRNQKPKSSTLLAATSLFLRTGIDRTDYHTSTVANSDFRSTESRFCNDFSKIPITANAPCTVQPKLKVGQANDKYEQEADQVADQVMRMPGPMSISAPDDCSRVSDRAPQKAIIQRVCTSPIDDKDLLQTKINGDFTPEVTPAINSGIQSVQGGGQPMSRSERNFFEPRFRADFSAVRIHNDSRANLLANTISARAFTLGSNVVFGAGEYPSESASGKRLLAHELAHVKQQGGKSSLIQRHATNQARLNNVCYQNANQQPTPSARQPELHPTYEQWLSSFAGLAEFEADDTFHPDDPNAADHVGPRFRVLGRQGRQFGDVAVRDIANHTPEEEHEHGQETVPVPVSGRSRIGEEFIDHPTNAWVVNCLPENLRATAFQLPSDCADIAVILRHVWLAAHNRTESYGRWTVGSGARRRRREIIAGDTAGDANQSRVRGLITDVYSGNVHRMVNGYATARGDSLTDFNQIQDLLHPGDILAWEHRETYLVGRRVRSRRTGGHVQTISEIVRNGNSISAIRVLQGNQPIFEEGAEEIMRSRGVQDPDGDSAEGRRLRNLPSRRIERSNAISTTNIEDPVSGAQVWGEIDERNDDGSIKEYTTLISAGPPRAASRPRVSGRGRQRIRRISDWFSRLGTVSLANLYGTLEAALLEARSIIDGGSPVSNSDADTLGMKAGENLWSRATRSGGTGGLTHFEPLHSMRASIRALGGIQPTVYHGNPSAAVNVRRVFLRIDNEFNFSARGGSSISFNRRVRRGGEVVKVLVTGFDPFSGNPPPIGDWNPSGAVALALDGKQESLGNHSLAAIESAVYPVSFAQFNQGIVERVVRASNADALLTVSLDPSKADASPVQIEQFTVGTHRLSRLQPHRLFLPEPVIPGNRGVAGGGNAIIETQADLQGIAADTELRDRQNNILEARPTVASEITFRLATMTEAQSFLNALNLQQTTTNRDVLISDPNAIRTIIANAARISDRRGLTAGIRVTLNNRQYRPLIIRGPGGSFLSNEVAYRTQRILQQRNSPAIAFHTHVPNVQPTAQNIPVTGPRRQRRDALRSAMRSIDRLVATMRRLIRAVGIRIVRQRNQGSGNSNSSNP